MSSASAPAGAPGRGVRPDADRATPPCERGAAAPPARPLAALALLLGVAFAPLALLLGVASAPLALLLGGAFAPLHADDVPPAPPPHPAPTEAPPATPAAPAANPAAPAVLDPLRIGEHALGEQSVVDGDTLRVSGEPSVRVLGLDCEEVFHDAKDRAAAEADFDAYARAKRGTSATPVKFGTPAGEAARDFVRALLAGAPRVRLERDEVGGHDVDGFDRRLAHALVLRPAGPLNLAVEVVRAGHSPYFVKYGRCLRFHADFVAAQAEAQAAKRGIWGATGPRHYPDYEERLAWWEQRARQVDAWRAAPDTPARIELGTLRAGPRLAERVGQDVVVFGALARLRADAWPRLLWLTHKRGQDLALVVRDEAVWKALPLEALGQRFATVTGQISLYRGRPQIEITDARQVSTP